jgi:hypothetical protein
MLAVSQETAARCSRIVLIVAADVSANVQLNSSIRTKAIPDYQGLSLTLPCLTEKVNRV